MWNGTASVSFEEMRDREGDLNDRQRRILELIERGHTNREIADTLGIGIDGAKWNVSEILTKLGLSSREEAADYWRWRKRRTPKVLRATRALIGLPALKWTGVTAAVLVSAVAVAGWLQGSDAAPNRGGIVTPFYLEARESVAVVVGPEEPREAVFRWSYQDATHFRTEYERVLPWFQSGTSLDAADGVQERTYDSSTNTYVERPIEPLLRWQRVRPTPTIMIGPAPADSMKGLMTLLAHWDEGSEWIDNGVKRVRPAPPPPVRLGTDIVLGRPVEVIKYVRGTLWVDPANMMILKHVSGHFSVVVTRFDERPSFPDTTFHLAKPGGARDQSELSTWSGSGVPGTVPASAAQTDVEVADESGETRRIVLPGLATGTYVPTFVPAGWEYRQGGSDSVYVEWTLRPIDWQGTPGAGALSGDFIRIEQAAGYSSLPEGLQAGSEYERVARGSATDAASWVAGGNTVIRVTASGRGSKYFDALVQGLTLQLHP